MSVSNFVAAIIPGCERGFGSCSEIGFHDDEGNLVAGVVYHNWSPETGVIEMSAGSVTRRWLTRERLKTIFAYPFEQIDCRMVVVRTSEKNGRVRRIWKSLGGKEYVIAGLRGPDEAEIIITLDREDWRAGKFTR
ncbi:MAG: hypothetical protein ACPG4X_16870 [Pikeienuella sp.]